MARLATAPDRLRASLHKGPDSHHGIDVLRLATGQAQARLEMNPAMLALLSPDLTAGIYREALTRLYGYYRGVEPWIAQTLKGRAMDLALGQRWRAPILMRDLLAIGVPYDEIDHLPVCAAPLNRRGEPEGVGALFAFECLARTGPVIAKYAQRRLGVRFASGGAHFTGHEADAGALWRAFGIVADEVLDTPARQRRAVTVARDTFLGLERWLSLP